MTATRTGRAHLVAGGFPPGQMAGHDHDYARLRILEMLRERDIHCGAANDFTDVAKWLQVSDLLITYVSGPFMADPEAEYVQDWLNEGGRWLALHGSSGGKAARIGNGRRSMVKMSHHETLGAFFISHPPVRKFKVDVVNTDHPLTKGLPASFETIDEPYMVEVLDLDSVTVLMTSELGPDPLPGKFGFDYETDTALLPDGKTRVIAYTKEVGAGGVTYITLGHCHTPSTNGQAYVDESVAPGGKTPPTLRVTWEEPAFEQFLRNAIDWGLGL